MRYRIVRSARSLRAFALPRAPRALQSFALSGAVGLFVGGCQTVSSAVEAVTGPDKHIQDAANQGLDATTGEAVAAEKARVAFARGAETFKASSGNDIGGARGQFESAAREDPQFALARYNVGVLLEKEGRHDDARRAYREALDRDPTLDLATNNLGLLLEAGGQVDAARALYNEIIEKHPEAVAARLRLARLVREAGDPKGARKLARDALQFDATSLPAYRMLARIYAEEKQAQLARLTALRGAKLAPDDPELNYALALVALNGKDVASARSLLSRVIDKDAEHVDARVQLADMALSNRDWKTASQQLEA